MTATSVNEVDLMILSLMKTSKPKDLALSLEQAMATLGKRFVKDGVALEPGEPAKLKAQELCQSFVKTRLPILERLGAV